MKISTYSIQHPVTTWVLNAMIVLVGLLAWEALPLREYPKTEIPIINVNTQLGNASPELVESSVTNVLEERLASIEGLETLESNSRYERSSVTLKLKEGTAMDKALAEVKEAIAGAALPPGTLVPQVSRMGGNEGAPFMMLTLEGEGWSPGELSHYAHLNLKNVLRSLEGVASVEVWGQPYTYKVTLDSKKLHAYGVSAHEVFEALAKAQRDFSAGKFQKQTAITLQATPKSVEAYKNIVVKQVSHDNSQNTSKDKAANPTQEHPVYLGDLANISLETQTDQQRIRVDGKPAVALLIQPASDANPLKVSQRVRQQLDVLRLTLPNSLRLLLLSDQAQFVRSSLGNLKQSVLEAILCVVAVVFLFLRSIRATLIPLIAIPISMLGSLVFLQAFGFSINLMTLLAMVLAIGLVVDDAIVVLENIERHIESGLNAYNAALKGAKEIGFAIVAMTLTLTSIYLPLAFIQGTLGMLFREFAVLLAGSVLVSGVVALTLSPLMSARLLSPKQNKPLFPILDRWIHVLTAGYKRGLTVFMKSTLPTAVILVLILAASVWVFKKLPQTIVPSEDRELIGLYMPPIPGKDMDAMEALLAQVEQQLPEIPEVLHKERVLGHWGASLILKLKPREERQRSAEAIRKTLEPIACSIPSADAYAWNADSGLPGMQPRQGEGALSLVLGTTASYPEFFEAAQHLQKMLEKAGFTGVRHDLRLNTLGYRVELDTHTMAQLDLEPHAVAKTLEIFMSGNKTILFHKDGVTYPITLEGKQTPWSLDELTVINKKNQRIALSAVARMQPQASSDRIFHTNQMRSLTLSADLPKGMPYAVAMQRFTQVIDKDLPANYQMIESTKAKLFEKSRQTLLRLFLLALVFIFAILAVQFENFVDPCIILFTVPLACLGGLALVWAMGHSMNIYTQIGLVTLIGLITKHGILIVTFANELRQAGWALKDAIIEASCLRLRPILMTTAAMVFGALPLMFASGAGAEARQALGTVLVGGLTFGTLFTLFVLPSVCLGIKRISCRSKRSCL